MNHHFCNLRTIFSKVNVDSHCNSSCVESRRIKNRGEKDILYTFKVKDALITLTDDISNRF